MTGPLIGVDMDHFIAHVYDPVKAREYYLRTRKLKGRKPGQQMESTSPVGTGVAKAPEASGAPAKPKTTGNRTAVLKERLARLEQVLSDLTKRVEAAKARSGITTPTKKSSEAEKSKDPSKPEKKSASEKRKDAKAAKERYEKNKTAETSQDAQAVQDEIEEVQKKIADARERLQQALAAAREKASSSKSPTAAVGSPIKK